MASLLIVDDSMVMRRTLTYTLRHAGYEVYPAGSGLEALEMLATDTPIDLLIADLYMPGMDGLELVRRVREAAPDRHLPVMMLTASGSDQDRLDALGHGIDRVLTKPTSSVELLETIEQLLKKPVL